MPNITNMYESIVTDENGEVKGSRKITTTRIPSEPPFIKVYLDTVLYLKDLEKSYNPILFSLLKHVSWASNDQLFTANKYIKEQIAHDANVSLSRVNQAINDFYKGEILFRKAKGIYAVNPYLFGKGDWKDVAAMRLTIDFAPGKNTFKSTVKYNENDQGQLYFNLTGTEG